jgi:hypothetical protein
LGIDLSRKEGALNRYAYNTAIGVFQIRQEGSFYIPMLNGLRLGSNLYIHAQFVVDDLVTGVIALPDSASAGSLGLPDDLSGWAVVDE